MELHQSMLQCRFSDASSGTGCRVSKLKSTGLDAYADPEVKAVNAKARPN